MDEAGRDFGQGREDEAPLLQPGMRRFQAFLLDDHIAVEEQIQVDHPWTPTLFSHAAHLLLDIQEERKKFVRADFGFERETAFMKGGCSTGPIGCVR